ncbi:MAG: MASE1 domain-containing protein [Actinomycetota bacterium]
MTKRMDAVDVRLTDAATSRSSPDRGRWPLPVVAALLAAAYAALYLSVTLVAAFGGANGTTFWPAAGLTVAVLLRRDAREWAWLLLAVWIAEFTLDIVVSNVPLMVAAGWATANCAEPALSAFLLRRNRHEPLNLARSDDLVRFVALAVIAGPVVGALIGVGSGVAEGFYGFWPAFPRWLAGDAIGALVIAPMLLIRRRDLRGPHQMRTTLLFAVGLGSGALLVTAPWGVPWSAALPFLIVPMLVLAAFRTGYPGTAISVAIIASVVNGMTAAGYGPFALADEISGLIEAQAFVAMCAFAGLVVAALTSDVVTIKESDRAKNALLQTVAHDLRGPLSAIVGFAAALALPERLDKSERDHMLARIEVIAARLSRMVTDILDLDRVSGAVRQPVDVSEIAHRLVMELESETHPIRVDAEPLVALVDPVDVERILENLLANSIRHTPSGTPIYLRVQERAEGLLLVVEDEGPGVDDDLKKAIFEPFHHGQTSQPGTGIGLALVAGLAKRHDGRAWVEDRVGGGASFRVLLRGTDVGSITPTG